MGIKRSRVRLSPKEYKKLCLVIHERDKWRCKVCRRRDSLHAHHIIYRSQSGDDASWNLLTLCNDCHVAVHDHYVIFLPLVEGEAVNADLGFKIMRVDNWKPKFKVR